MAHGNFALAAALSLLVLAPARAGAEEPMRPAPDTMAPFYRELRRPGYARAATLRAHAIRQIEAALESVSPFRRAAHLESALTRLTLARALAPDDAELLFYLGYALARWDTPGTSRRSADALDAFLALRALDADFREAEVSFELGVLYTRARDFARATEEYERGIAATPSADEASTPYANLAEVTMLSGDLPTAIEHYERAVELAAANGPRGTTSLFLSLLGLAVALDRSGDSPAAFAAARRAHALGGTFAPLRSPEVFFEPAYELRYYEALAALALSEQAGDSQRRYLRTMARASFMLFMREGGADSPFAAAAQRHIDALSAAPDAPR